MQARIVLRSGWDGNTKERDWQYQTIRKASNIRIIAQVVRTLSLVPKLHNTRRHFKIQIVMTDFAGLIYHTAELFILRMIIIFGGLKGRLIEANI